MRVLGESQRRGPPKGREERRLRAMSDAVAIRQPTPSSLAHRDELTIEDMIAQVQKIQMVMERVMKEWEHYGVIPGTGTKPSLLKPGAEKLCMLFRLAPDPHSVEVYDGK